MTKDDSTILKTGLPVTLGEALLILRRRKGWTQNDLSRQSGISPYFVSLAENDSMKVGTKTLFQLFSTLNHTLIIRVRDYDNNDE